MHNNKIKSEIGFKVLSVVGLGYVGLPLSKRLTECDFIVKGIDVNQSLVDSLSAGYSKLCSVPSDTIREMQTRGFSASTDFSVLAEVDVVIFCVPTPLCKNKQPDLVPLKEAIMSAAPHFRPGQLISVESTTWPGTTREIIVPIIEKYNLKVGQDIFLAYSPEREDPGNKKYLKENIPKIVSGLTSQCASIAFDFYSSFINTVVKVSSLEVAEMTKLLENSQRAINISFINEFKMICNELSIDIFEVIDAAATKPFGFSKYYPSVGIGGHCIAVDPLYLEWKMQEFDIPTQFIRLAHNINSLIQNFILDKTTHVLSESGKTLKNSKVLVLGVTYKRNIDDIRESASVKLIKKLHHLGAIVDYSDSHVPNLSLNDYNGTKFAMRSVHLSKCKVKEYDICLLLTDHHSFDYQLIYDYSRLIVDATGRFKVEEGKVWRA